MAFFYCQHLKSDLLYILGFPLVRLGSGLPNVVIYYIKSENQQEWEE